MRILFRGARLYRFATVETGIWAAAKTQTVVDLRKAFDFPSQMFTVMAKVVLKPMLLLLQRAIMGESRNVVVFSSPHRVQTAKNTIRYYPLLK